MPVPPTKDFIQLGDNATRHSPPSAAESAATAEDLRRAAAALESAAEHDPGTFQGRADALRRVARWLWTRARALDGLPGPSTCCECGAALAHVAGPSVRAVLCPECDRDALLEHTDQSELASDAPSIGHDSLLPALELSVQLAELGREAARDAWVEHAGQLEQIPRSPELRAWLACAHAFGLAEHVHQLTEVERRVLVHAYRNELHVLAAGGAR